jgi:hypothetical protein
MKEELHFFLQVDTWHSSKDLESQLIFTILFMTSLSYLHIYKYKYKYKVFYFIHPHTVFI